MNGQLNTALVAIITKVTSAVDASVSFLQAELPDVIHQLLMWKLVESLLTLVIPIVTLAISLTLFLWGIRYNDRKDALYRSNVIIFEEQQGRVRKLRFEYSEEAQAEYDKQCEILRAMEVPQRLSEKDFALRILAPGACGVISLFAALGYMNLGWLQILVAPKIYLIEYAATLVK